MTSLTLQQRTTAGLCTLLAILTAVTLLYCGKQWWSDWQLAHQPLPHAAALADETTSLIEKLPEEHIFGQDSGNVPVTSLELRVTGIVKIDTEEGGEVSKAYISIAGAPSKIYQSGDDLPYGVKIHDITADAVILENDGKLEKLPLPREPLEFKPMETQKEE